MEESIGLKRVNYDLRGAEHTVYGLCHALLSSEFFQKQLNKFKESISYSGPIIWNAFPSEIKANSFSDELVKWMTQA